MYSGLTKQCFPNTGSCMLRVYDIHFDWRSLMNEKVLSGLKILCVIKLQKYLKYNNHTTSWPIIKIYEPQYPKYNEVIKPKK